MKCLTGGKPPHLLPDSSFLTFAQAVTCPSICTALELVPHALHAHK